MSDNTRVWVQIPANTQWQHECGMSMSLADAKEMQKEARSHKDHAYYGMKIIDESEWDLYRVVRNHLGHPVSNPEQKTLAREKYEDHLEDIADISQADAQTKEDVTNEIKLLREQVRALTAEQKKRDKQVVAEAKQKEKALLVAKGKKTKK